MTANGAASTGVYPQEDEEGNPVGISPWDSAPISNAFPAHYRIWLLHLSRSSDYINTGNAGAGTSRAITARR